VRVSGQSLCGLPPMRKPILAALLLCSACSSPEDADSFERWYALNASVEPASTVAVAAIWYADEHGRWPTALSDVEDLSEELGHALQEPPEPIPIPTAGEFRSPAVAAFADSPARPAVEVYESRGVIDVSAGRIGIDRASVTVEGSQRYKSVGDTLTFGPVVFLEPIPREGYPLH
jgi:hypothetical protein